MQREEEKLKEKAKNLIIIQEIGRLGDWKLAYKVKCTFVFR